MDIPYIKHDVLIGYGLVIIGDIRIGHHSKIETNCIVLESVPSYSTVVLQKIRIIINDDNMRIIKMN